MSIHDVIVMLKWRHPVASQRIQDFLKVFFSSISNINEVLSVGQEKRIKFSCEDEIENLSLMITICHHSARLVMPIYDSQDRYIYPTITLMKDSNIQRYNYCPECSSLLVY